MKFIYSESFHTKYSLIGKYIVNLSKNKIGEFNKKDYDPIFYGVIDIPSLEKLTEAYKTNPDEFRNLTEKPYSIDELLKETDSNQFLLSVIGMETTNLKTIKSLINYGNGQIVCDMIYSNHMVQRSLSLVDMIVKKYADDNEVLSYFTERKVIENLPNSIINRLFDIGSPDITYRLIAYDRLSKKDLEPLFESDNITILTALARFAKLNESQRETFLHHPEEDVWLAFRRRDDLRPKEDKYLWDRIIESQREYEAEMERQREIKRQERLEWEKKIEMELAAERQQAQQAETGIGKAEDSKIEHIEPTIFKP